MSTPPKGIPGRWFTICFGSLLALGVVVGFSAVIRFQKTMMALDSVRSLWPDAAAALEEQYQVIDRLITQGKASDAEISEARLNEWQRARNEFKTSTQYDIQARQVVKLETLADRLVPTRDDDPTSRVLPASLQKFIEADRALGSLKTDALGWLCTQMFRMNIPDQIYMLLE